MIFYGIKSLQYENSHNLKSGNNCTSEMKLVNISYFNTHIATHHVALNDNSDDRERDCSKTTSSSNSNKTIPLWFIIKTSEDSGIKLMNYLCSGLLIFPI